MEEGATIVKVGERVKCQSKGVREGETVRELRKDRERDVAHALVVIHSLTCGEHQ